MGLLWERLAGRDSAGNTLDGKIEIQPFTAAVAEYVRGTVSGYPAAPAVKTTRADVINRWSLSPVEQQEMDDLIATVSRATRPLNATIIRDVLDMLEVGIGGCATPDLARRRCEVPFR